ncbi:hypothetical protein E2320_004807, partial [Naja naja]
MAAHSVAAAFRSPVWCVFLVYSRQELTCYGLQSARAIESDFQRTHSMPEEIARPPRSPWIVACLKTVFPEFAQYVTCATRENNTLDHVYSN